MLKKPQNDTNLKIGRTARSEMILNDKIQLRELSDQRLANRLYLQYSLTTLDSSKSIILIQTRNDYLQDFHKMIGFKK